MTSNTDAQKRSELAQVFYGHYKSRAIGMVVFFGVMSLAFLERDIGTGFWIFLILNSFVWPHAGYLIGRRARDPMKVESWLMAGDSFVVGFYICVISFSLWPSVAAIAGNTVSNLAGGNVRVQLRGMAITILTYLVTGLFIGYEFRPESSLPTSLVSIGFVLSYIAITSNAANQVFLKLYRSRKALEEANAEVTRINDMAQMVNSTLDLDNVMDLVIKSLNSVFPFNQVCIGLINKELNSLVFGRAYGELRPEQIEAWSKQRISLSNTNSWFVRSATEKIPLYMPEITEQQLEHFDAADRQLYDVNPILSVLICPLEVQGESIGSIVFGDSRQTFELDDEEIARIVRYITQIATAINNARVYRDMQALQEALESQRHDLEQSRKLIRRYVPSSVVDSIIDGRLDSVDKPQRRRVTILFSDIVGFTNMADRMDAESMTQVLNEYMISMAEIIERHGGTLTEFAGDGLMSLFGAPVEMEPEDQVESAVRAALEMQASIPDLNKGWLKLGMGNPLTMRIGINTGVLSVGSFGSEGRMTYTAIGLQTNVASRIESHCESGGVLLSEDSWHLVKDRIDCVPKGEVKCKGVHYPVKVYAPVDVRNLKSTVGKRVVDINSLG